MYSGYLAAINITALIAWIAEFDFSRETVKTEDEIGAAVLCALGGKHNSADDDCAKIGFALVLSCRLRGVFSAAHNRAFRCVYRFSRRRRSHARLMLVGIICFLFVFF